MITEVSPARLIAGAIVATGLGVTSNADWKTTYGLVPSENPVRRIGVLSTTPINHGKDPDGSPSQHLGVQVTVRANTIEESNVKCLQIIRRLLQASPVNYIAVTAGGTEYHVLHVVLASGPIYVGTNEDKDAAKHTVNFLFTAVEYA